MENTAAQAGRAAIFGGGPLYTDGQPVMDILRASGFTTVILWSLHVSDNGDLYYNDVKIVSNGAYVGDSTWPGLLGTLKQAPTSVNRIEVSVGAGGTPDWEHIMALVDAQGTGPGSILYQNFQALRAATGADAINSDDESCYDVESTLAFAHMIATIGFRSFTFAPYTYESYWAQVKQILGDQVDRAYLQCYSGGTGNDPKQWSQALGMSVDPGLWCRNGAGCAEGDSPAQVASQLQQWHSSADIPGGFIWLYDDIKHCEPSTGFTAADYARAVVRATSAIPAPTR